MSESAVDIVVILDGSDSLSEQEFEKLKTFTKSLVDKYGVSKPGPHFAVVEFSKDPTIAIRLDDHFDAVSLKSAIDNIKPSGSLQVRTDEALTLVVNEVFKPESGGRPSVPKIVVLVTDDESTGDRSLDDVYKDAERQGTRILVVTIGSNVDRDDLKKLVPKDDNIIDSPDVDDLENVAKNIVNVIKTDIKERKYLKKELRGRSKTAAYAFLSLFIAGAVAVVVFLLLLYNNAVYIYQANQLAPLKLYLYLEQTALIHLTVRKLS